MTKEQATRRIEELKSTPSALVASDSGTHSKPRVFSIHEDIFGERFCSSRFGGDQSIKHTEAYAEAHTEGRIRRYPTAQADIRSKAAELRKLEKMLQKL